MDSPAAARLRCRPRPRSPVLSPPTSCPSPVASPAVSSLAVSSPAPASVTRVSSIIHHGKAVQDPGTPEELRLLEKEWKQRRRRVLEDITLQSGQQERPVAASRALSRKQIAITRQTHLSPLNTPVIDRAEAAASQSVRCQMASSHPPTPPDTPPTLPLYTKVANVSPKVVNTSPTQTVPKQPSFPREAIPPKPLDMPITPMGSMNGPSSKKHSNLPGPILASPLPPKSEPPNRTLIRQDTIFVYPRKGIELILCLADRQEEICVSSHGKRLSIRSLKEGAATAPKQIILEHSSKWGKGERREWERVRKLVEVYKRQTPQAKLYHALGNITVTCSSPPDIILSFQLTPLRTPASRAAVADARVRVTYSRIARELRVDTSSIKPSKTGQGTKGSYEKLRTKRILSLRSDGTVDSMEKKGSTKDWRPEEMEGLKRLWNSMEAWNRWEGAGSGPG